MSADRIENPEAMLLKKNNSSEVEIIPLSAVDQSNLHLSSEIK